jgi:hypothetical protein
MTVECSDDGQSQLCPTCVHVYVWKATGVDEECMHNPAAVFPLSSSFYSPSPLTNRHSKGQLVPVMLELAYSKAQPTVTYTANDPPEIWQVWAVTSSHSVAPLLS